VFSRLFKNLVKTVETLAVLKIDPLISAERSMYAFGMALSLVAVAEDDGAHLKNEPRMHRAWAL
jgi:hypothetical protein